MEITKIKDFDTISQRILYGYNFAFSDFAPVKSDSADADAQREAHCLMRRITDELYKNPALLDLPLAEDDSYGWYVCNNQRPQLNEIYLDAHKKVYEFYKFLYFSTLSGDIQSGRLRVKKDDLRLHKAPYKAINKNLLRTVGFDVVIEKENVVLQYAGAKGVLPALKFLAKVHAGRKPAMKFASDLKPVFEFIRCTYSGSYEYILERIDALYEYDGMLMDLKKQCLDDGYKQILYLDVGPTSFCFNVLLQKDVGGFRIGYNPRKYQQFCFATMNGIGEKAMLEDFCNLSADMQKHFVEICRPCNGCLGCTKGGRTKPYTVEVQFRDRVFDLCPQFPQHEWEVFTPDRINTLFEYHDLQEKYAR